MHVRWEHKLEFKFVRSASPSTIATMIAEGLESLPPGFRARLDSSGDTLDDLARYMREDAVRGCTLDEIDGWLEKLYDFGDTQRLWLNVGWAGEPGEVVSQPADRP